MSTNSNFTVAVHILTMLANSSEPLPSSFIASSVNTNPVIIRRMIGRLHDAGLVVTLPGSGGGAVLGAPAAAISLADVYRVTRDDFVFGLHPNTPNPNCVVGRNIQAIMIQLFDEVDQLILEKLSGTSIQNMLDAVRQREA